MKEPPGATATASNGNSKGAVPQRARSLDMNNPEAEDGGSSSSSSVTSTRAATSVASIPAIAEPPTLPPPAAELTGSSQLVHVCHSLPHGSRSNSRTHSPVRSVSTITPPSAAALQQHQQQMAAQSALEVLGHLAVGPHVGVGVGPGAGYSGPYPVLESGQTVRYRRSHIDWWNADLQTLPPVALFVSGFARGLSQREYELLLLERLGPGTPFSLLSKFILYSTSILLQMYFVTSTVLFTKMDNKEVHLQRNMAASLTIAKDVI